MSVEQKLEKFIISRLKPVPRVDKLDDIYDNIMSGYYKVRKYVFVKLSASPLIYDAVDYIMKEVPIDRVYANKITSDTYSKISKMYQNEDDWYTDWCNSLSISKTDSNTIKAFITEYSLSDAEDYKMANDLYNIIH